MSMNIAVASSSLVPVIVHKPDQMLRNVVKCNGSLGYQDILMLTTDLISELYIYLYAIYQFKQYKFTHYSMWDSYSIVQYRG